MYMDSPMAIYTENDGIVSLMHCQEWNSVSLLVCYKNKNGIEFRDIMIRVIHALSL